MSTFKLVLTDLQVESFPTNATDGLEGTVRAYAPDDAAPAKCTYDRPTCTCPVFPSCAGNETCLYTECVSCPVPVPVTAACADVDVAKAG